MAKVITVSRYFPAYHPKHGEATLFVHKIKNALALYGEAGNGLDKKSHTIRAGKRWKTGDEASIRYWSDKPYRSPQIKIADVTLPRVADIEITDMRDVIIDGVKYGDIYTLAANDGLSRDDLVYWFNKIPFSGQILFFVEIKTDY